MFSLYIYYDSLFFAKHKIWNIQYRYVFRGSIENFTKRCDFIEVSCLENLKMVRETRGGLDPQISIFQTQYTFLLPGVAQIPREFIFRENSHFDFNCRL